MCKWLRKEVGEVQTVSLAGGDLSFSEAPFIKELLASRVDSVHRAAVEGRVDVIGLQA